MRVDLCVLRRREEGVGVLGLDGREIYQLDGSFHVHQPEGHRHVERPVGRT
jgi:hypothetical protein